MEVGSNPKWLLGRGPVRGSKQGKKVSIKLPLKAATYTPCGQELPLMAALNAPSIPQGRCGPPSSSAPPHPRAPTLASHFPDRARSAAPIRISSTKTQSQGEGLSESLLSRDRSAGFLLLGLGGAPASERTVFEEDEEVEDEGRCSSFGFWVWSGKEWGSFGCCNPPPRGSPVNGIISNGDPSLLCVSPSSSAAYPSADAENGRRLVLPLRHLDLGEEECTPTSLCTRLCFLDPLFSSGFSPTCQARKSNPALPE